MTPAASTPLRSVLLDGVYAFDHDHGAPARELTHLLGGKGAGLAEMTRNLGINVPPGFTVSLPLCRQYRAEGWPEGLDASLAAHIERLGGILGRRFGDASDPLLVSVRSGAPISMPGMLDTVLNLGMNDETVDGLAAASGDERFAWDSYRRFLQMFGSIVRGLPARSLPLVEECADAKALRTHVRELKRVIARTSGRAVPADPFEQLREAVEAVFRSWDSPRAVAYREREGIDPELGTAVSVQSMVFGNRGSRSGTGVVFTRDPNTGVPELYGDYLPLAQGEDVVGGTARTMPIAALADHEPAIFELLGTVLRRLEIHYRDMCDVEFTVEEGTLWVLQTRVGKRGAVAAVRIAADLVEDPDIALTRAEAVARVPRSVRERARAELFEHLTERHDGTVPFAAGLGASSGRATGAVVLSAAAAIASDGNVILVRPETSPEDVMGMSASVGILTIRGGLVSHAAVVARGWGIPAVVGAHDLVIEDEFVVAPDGTRIRQGETITIDGRTGHVWVGEVGAEEAAEEIESEELAALETWAVQHAPEEQEEEG
ncbi:pyruvate, phosphate dikinase [Microbacterium aurum]